MRYIQNTSLLLSLMMSCGGASLEAFDYDEISEKIIRNTPNEIEVVIDLSIVCGYKGSQNVIINKKQTKNDCIAAIEHDLSELKKYAELAYYKIEEVGVKVFGESPSKSKEISSRGKGDLNYGLLHTWWSICNKITEEVKNNRMMHVKYLDEPLVMLHESLLYVIEHCFEGLSNLLDSNSNYERYSRVVHNYGDFQECCLGSLGDIIKDIDDAHSELKKALKEDGTFELDQFAQGWASKRKSRGGCAYSPKRISRGIKSRAQELRENRQAKLEAFEAQNAQHPASPSAPQRSQLRLSEPVSTSVLPRLEVSDSVSTSFPEHA